MSEALPNLEQINLCKSERHKVFFGKFDNRLQNVRDSTEFTFTECLYKAKNDLHANMACINNTIEQMKMDNENIIYYFQNEYKKYC